MSILERLTCETADLGEENVKKLLALFPECACEQGQVDFDKLRQVLSSHVLEGDVERYQFTWPGKRAAMAEANRKTNKTFRPVREDETTPTGMDSEGHPYCSSGSVNFDSTENLYIEGDNLEALKLLQSAYAGKVKMIYIDPPYNTGKDFVYRDYFSLDDDEIKVQEGIFADDGKMFTKYERNEEGCARYHTNWCNMIYPRLKLARELLSDDGVIFISIDDSEEENLKKICDEVVGENNFIVQYIWEKHKAPKNDNKYVTTNHEYVIVYAKDKEKFVIKKDARDSENLASFKNEDNDPRGPWSSGPLLAPTFSQTSVFPIINPHGKEVYPPKGKCWSFSKSGIEKLLGDNRIWFGSDGHNVPRIKRFLSELPDGIVPRSMLFHDVYGGNQKAANDLKKIFEGKKIFDYSKPIDLIKYFIDKANGKESLILDFFSGSATTAHAVMQLNAEDGGKRKFILVQWPEVTDEKSEAYKAGYQNICEIGKERIRRAGKKIQEENATTAPNLDVGFRVLKIDSTSINDVSKPVGEIAQAELFETERIKVDRSSEDLLFQVLLQTQIPLSEKIEREMICGNEVFWVGGVMVACLDKQAKLTEDFFTALAERQPAMAFFRDDTFVDDSARTNLDQIFKQFSKDTKIKVL